MITFGLFSFLTNIVIFYLLTVIVPGNFHWRFYFSRNCIFRVHDTEYLL